MTVSIVGVHHEGRGKPRTVDLSHAGYSAGIFDGGRWAIWRQPDDPRGAGFHDFSTAGYTAKVCGVVLTGNRHPYKDAHGNDVPAYPVTDLDRRAMRELAAEFRKRGWLVAQPNVWAHRQFPPPNATVCAGYNVGPAVPAKGLTGDNLTWLSIVPCFHEKAVPPMPAKVPTMWPAVDDVVDGAPFGPNNEYVVMVTADGHVYCPKGGDKGSPYNPDGTPKDYWKLPDGKVRGASSVAGNPNGYVITSTADQPYSYPDH